MSFLTEQGALAPARIVPRYLTRRASAERLRNLATPTLPVDLIED